MFGHDRFEAYQLAIKFVAQTTSIFALVPAGNANIVDQLKRASISVPLTIAEGSGKTTSIDKKRFYAIARGSAMECAALLDVLVAYLLISPGHGLGPNPGPCLFNLLGQRRRPGPEPRLRIYPAFLSK